MIDLLDQDAQTDREDNMPPGRGALPDLDNLYYR